MEDQLKAAFLGMKRQEAIDLVKTEIERGTDPLAILRVCRKAMEEVGKRFETGQFFLSELIYSGEVFKGINTLLEPVLTTRHANENPEGVIVLGTPKGDIHDLGKNIVITMMRAHGFTVHDLGVDVPPQKFIAEIKRTESLILAMSALITPTFKTMKEITSMLKEEGLREKTYVIIGGAVTSEFVQKEVGADAQSLDPTEAIRLCRNFLSARKPTADR
jgi:5-methyltetrahydrofolate--homocysteine methyltransferase